MSMRQTIESKIMTELSPEHLEVIDESHMHSVPPGAESHFKLIIVSEKFGDESLIRRHQRVNGILTEELNGGLHALSLQTLTAEEWQKKGGETAASPPCLGGGKTDKTT